MLKNLQISIILLLSHLFLSTQKYEMFISPIYSETQPKSNTYLPNMVTYCDYNSVAVNFDKLLRYNLQLNNGEQKDWFNKELTIGTITDVYTTHTGQKIERIYLKYNVFEYNNLWVIKSVEITGDLRLLVAFYLYSFPTAKVQEGDIKKKELVFTNYNFDKISFQIKGKPMIKITSNQFKNKGEFSEYREKSKKEYFIKKAEIEEKRKAEADSIRLVQEKQLEELKRQKEERAIQREQERKERIEIAKNAIPKSDTWIVIKKGNNIKIVGKTNEKVKSAIEQRINTEKDGHYSVFIPDTRAEGLELRVRKTH